MKDLTQEGFEAYLVANPEKVHVCGNATECVIAQYVADELAEDSDFEFPHRRLVDVDGTGVQFYSSELRPDGSVQDEAGSDYIELPDWAQNVIGIFDAMEDEYEEASQDKWYTWFDGDQEGEEPVIEEKDAFTGAEVLARLREKGAL